MKLLENETGLMRYEFIGGPEHGRWLEVPDHLPSAIDFPIQVPYNQIVANPIVELTPIMLSRYRKVYGHYIDETGVERSLRYEFEGIL